MTDELKGKDYRVRARHPRRDQPLGDITDALGQVIATAGGTCEHVSPEQLASMIANGYVERIEGGEP